jgi:hypothetical protein
MGIKDGTIDYTLTAPCQIITPQDGQITWETATLREPSAQHARWYLKLEDMLGKALLDSQTMYSAFSNLPDEPESVAGETVSKFHELDEGEHEAQARQQSDVIKLLLINSDRADRYKFLDLFEKMALANTDQAIISCNSSYRLKRSYWDVLSLKDRLAMAYLWAAFFVLPSLTSGPASD